MNKTPPVLFLVFNRPDLAERVFRVIQKVKPSQFFIAADGPRGNVPNESNLCQQCRDFVHRVDWPCDLKTLFRSENIGCRNAVSGAINWFFEHVDEGIILEDDCVPDPTFFQYCAELLQKYRHVPRVLSINGNNLGYARQIDHSYGFTIFMNMWGWASWSDRARKIDYTLKDWGTVRSRLNLALSLQRTQRNPFRFDYCWFKIWCSHFSSTKSRNFDTWDYQWIFFAMMNRLVSVFPAVNLVSNIGFGDGATHTFDGRSKLANLPTFPMHFPLSHPNCFIFDSHYERNYVQEAWNHHTPWLRQDLRELLVDLTSYGKADPTRLRVHR